MNEQDSIKLINKQLLLKPNGKIILTTPNMVVYECIEKLVNLFGMNYTNQHYRLSKSKAEI